jgi:hypothetical protein
MLFGIMNYEGLLFDVLGSVDEVVEDKKNEIDVTVLGNETVGEILNKEEEFPYDWSTGRYVYIAFLSLTFMGTIILEGIDTSLMAKVTPAKLNSAFINSGLLATLIGTLGKTQPQI